MDRYMCSIFQYITKNLEYDSSNERYKFKDDRDFTIYCTDGKCEEEIDKISAACLYFFDQFFKDNSVAKSNVNIVEYIMIWLSYMLIQTQSRENNSLNKFYTKHIKNGDQYKNNIEGVTAYKNYKDIIDKNDYFLSMDKSIISKLYDALTSLCSMYFNDDGHDPNCDQCKKAANTFVERYEETIKDPNISKNGLYRKILSILYTLSNDYDNLKKKNNDSSSLPSIKTKIYMPIYGFSSLIFLIENNFYILFLIFGIIIVFIGIYYKYSLSGFRNRFKKLYLRKKLKKMKKEWTINI
ncbi:PIR protein [Plasmodium yoelii]|uniref:PIR protein n=2 Tax=Plasmodium yoelii TaxID=5861 RepID=A0AAE9WKT2_PLAYO|nr:PIR protein [Plasmodium yoelii]WBY55852.1 PIR protein [Plasmodium yoelii yoelii]CDR19180.1 YIR protein [Plasmodium yoelii]VTZ75074.1 PIR protein [Plasmodium yoelii]|eukprot:XP_034493421.1 PIR protein [Plasmodium yoelii]